MTWLTFRNVCVTDDNECVPCFVVVKSCPFFVHDLLLNMTYHQICIMSNTTDATNGAQRWFSFCSKFRFLCIVFYGPWCVFWIFSVPCIYFWLLITSLVSSDFSLTAIARRWYMEKICCISLNIIMGHVSFSTSTFISLQTSQFFLTLKFRQIQERY